MPGDAQSRTVMEFPSAGDLTKDDVLYLIQGTGVDRDRRVPLDMLRAFLKGELDRVLFWDVRSSAFVDFTGIPGNTLVLLEGKSAQAHTFTLAGTIPDGLTVTFMVPNGGLSDDPGIAFSIVSAGVQLASVRGGEVVVVTKQGHISSVVSGAGSFRHLNGVQWLESSVIEAFFEGLGYHNPGSDGQYFVDGATVREFFMRIGLTGEELASVLAGFGTTPEQMAETTTDLVATRDLFGTTPQSRATTINALLPYADQRSGTLDIAISGTAIAYNAGADMDLAQAMKLDQSYLRVHPFVGMKGFQIDGSFRMRNFMPRLSGGSPDNDLFHLKFLISPYYGSALEPTWWSEFIQAIHWWNTMDYRFRGGMLRNFPLDATGEIQHAAGVNEIVDGSSGIAHLHLESTAPYINFLRQSGDRFTFSQIVSLP